MKRRYHTVTATYRGHLDAAVENWLADGWQLQGGVAISQAITAGGDTHHEYAQAVTKSEKRKGRK